MKLGVCTAFEYYEKAAALGFEFIECNLSPVAAMSEAEFEALLKKKESLQIPIERSNGFLPGDLKVTGPNWDEEAIRAYLDRALMRAAALGVKTAVFGSGGARNVPEGWSFDSAWKQLAQFLKIASEYAEKYGVKIAIEPLRRQECNIVNLVSEAAALTAWVNSPWIGVLADTFHMLAGQEPWSAMERAGDKLMHVHISGPLPDMSGRIYPAAGDGADYEGIFDALKRMNYEGYVSVEAGFTDFETDGRAAVECLRGYLK